MKHIHTFESFLNEANVSWTEKSGVTEFKIHGTTYSLYNVDKKLHWELYKFDEDNGPLVMKFKIEKGQMFFLYGGFDLDNVSRAYQKEIIDAVCSYFKIDPNKIVY